MGRSERIVKPPGCVSLQSYDLCQGLDQEVKSLLLSQYGDEHLHRILENLKFPPSYTSVRVNTLLINSEDAKEELMQALAKGGGGCETSFNLEFHDVLENCLLLRENLVTGPLHHSVECESEPLSMILVDRLCGEAVLRGSDIFVSGILGAQKGMRRGDRCSIYAHVGGRGVFRGMTVESYESACIFLGEGIAEVSRSDIFRLPNGIGVKVSRTVGPRLPPLNGLMNGKILMQNIPSIVVPIVLDPRPGDVVLDMCSAPGGKTTHIAALMDNRGVLVACEKSKNKMMNARKRFHKMNASVVIPLVLDSTKMVIEDEPWISPIEIIKNAQRLEKAGEFLNVQKFYPHSFEKILVDPPCSALGLRPRLFIELNLRSLRKIIKYQKAFVENAVQLLKEKGVMTYSTCTINSEENEGMVKWILNNFSCLTLVPIDISFGGKPGLPNCGLSDVERNMVRRFDVCDQFDTMGFFIAKFVKN